MYTSGSSKSSLLTLYYSHLHGQSSLLITITSDRLSKYLSTRSSSLLTTYSSSFRILIEKNVISTTLSLFLHSINHRTVCATWTSTSTIILKRRFTILQEADTFRSYSFIHLGKFVISILCPYQLWRCKGNRKESCTFGQKSRFSTSFCIISSSNTRNSPKAFWLIL